jgi:hypothetical protein
MRVPCTENFIIIFIILIGACNFGFAFFGSRRRGQSRATEFSPNDHHSSQA